MPLSVINQKKAVIPFEERLEIVSACRYVDVAVEQSSMDKLDAHNPHSTMPGSRAARGHRKSDGGLGRVPGRHHRRVPKTITALPH